MAKNDFQYGGWNLTPCNVAQLWHWFRQVTAPCNVACGSGIMTVNSPSGSTLQCDTALALWHWIRQVAAPCNVAGGSGMSCHGIRPNIRRIGILHLVSISAHQCSRHVILYQSANFYPNRPTLGRKNDVMSIFKMAYLSHLRLQGSNNGFFESPVKLTQLPIGRQ